MVDLLGRIEEKKQRFDSYKPLPVALENNLSDWFRIALTYSSNALEGNTLSHAETALIVEKNMTVGGKSVTEHLEALNHAQAITFVQALAHEKKCSELTLDAVLAIHKLILQKINDAHAGIFRSVAVRVMGSQVPRPNYLKVPQLMSEFIEWLHAAPGPVPQIAADAHLKFVFIHPFIDGNGRAARLLLNLVLLQAGYPLVCIEKEKRLDYINAIEEALAQNKRERYYLLIFQAIEHSLDAYLGALAQSNV